MTIDLDVREWIAVEFALDTCIARVRELLALAEGKHDETTLLRGSMLYSEAALATIRRALNRRLKNRRLKKRGPAPT